MISASVMKELITTLTLHLWEFRTKGAISLDKCGVFYIGLGNYPFILRSN